MTKSSMRAQIVALITAYRQSAALKTILDLQIPELLRDGPQDLGSLSSRIGCSVDDLRRILEFCECMDIVVIKSDSVELRPLGQELNSSPFLRDWARCELQPAYWNAWSHLSSAITSNSTAFSLAHGSPFFEYLAANAPTLELFQATMQAQTESIIPAILESYSFGEYKRIIDIGGGNGQLIKAIVAQHDNVIGTLFDRPEVTQAFKSSHKRLNVVAGDFLRDQAPAGDLHVLKNVLHDWDDQRGLTILANCSASLQAGQKLLIIELVKSDIPGDPQGKGLDLLMMMLLSGQERTVKEFEDLARQADLVLENVHSTNAPVSLLEFKKVSK